MIKRFLISVFCILFACLSTITLFSQAPEGIIYQAEARTQYGNLIRFADLDVKITILSGAPDGTVVWEGDHQVRTDAYGQFTLVIGEGTGGSYDFSAIPWATNTHFLNVKITDRWGRWLDMGTTQFLSVPYALHANSASSVEGISYLDLTNVPTSLSEFINDEDFISLESDPVFTTSASSNITPEDITRWNSDQGGVSEYFNLEGSEEGDLLMYDGEKYIPAELNLYYTDTDGDGYGDSESNPVFSPLPPEGYVSNDEDCNDSDADINPEATEVLDDIDNNCNGEIDEGLDRDGDGYTEEEGDCDNLDPNVHPDAEEICDGIDNDCDGTIDQIPCDVNNGTGFCDNGDCLIESCNEGYSDCNGYDPDGCETDIYNDKWNCGACGHICNIPNATAICINGECGIWSCEYGWADCNEDPLDGCETYILTSMNNCGVCGNSCYLDHAISACESGTCVLRSCESGWANCDGNNSNGCETQLDYYNNDFSTAYYAGHICADEACGILCSASNLERLGTVSGNNSRWYYYVLDECSLCTAGLKGWITLSVPYGVDYDLYAYDENHVEIGKSTNTAGFNEEIDIVWDGGTMGTDNYPVYLEVRFVSGSTCDNWDLSFYGTDCE